MSATAGRRALALVLLAWTALAIVASVLTPLFEPAGEVALLDAVTGGDDRPRFLGALGIGAAPPLPRLLYGAGARALGLDTVRLLPRPAPEQAPGRPRYQHGADELAPFAGPARRVHVLRLLPVLLGALTLAITARLAERLRAGSGWLAAALLGASPAVIGRFTGCGEQAVVMAAGALALLGLARVARAEGSRARDGLLAGLGLGAAQLASPSCAWLLLLVPVALALRARREPGRRALVATLDRILLGLLPLAGPYWAYNLVHAGGPWAPVPQDWPGPPLEAGPSLPRSLLTGMTPTVEAGAPLPAVWSAVAVLAALGLARGLVARRDLCPRLLVLLLAAAAADLLGLVGHDRAVAPRRAEMPWPHPGLGAGGALLAAGVLGALPRARAAGTALAALLAGALVLLAFRAQASELGTAGWAPPRALDAHLMAFDPLAPVPPERRLDTIRWLEPADGDALPAAPLLAWRAGDDPDARFTVHLSSPGLSRVLATHEDTGLLLRDRYQVPPALWSRLPAGVPVTCRVLRLPTLEQALAAPCGALDVDQSPPITLRRVPAAR